MLTELFLVLDRVDTLRVPVVFRELSLLHVFDTALPLCLARMRTVRSDLRELLHHRLLVDSWLPRLSLVRGGLSLQVLEGHHLPRFLRHNFFRRLTLRGRGCAYRRCLRPAFLNLVLFWLFLALCEAHRRLGQACGATSTTWGRRSSCLFFYEHFLGVLAAGARVQLIVVGLLASRTSPLPLVLQVSDSDLLAGTAHISEADLAGGHFLLLALVEYRLVVLAHIDWDGLDFGRAALVNKAVVLAREHGERLASPLPETLISSFLHLD